MSSNYLIGKGLGFPIFLFYKNQVILLYHCCPAMLSRMTVVHIIRTGLGTERAFSLSSILFKEDYYLKAKVEPGREGGLERTIVYVHLGQPTQTGDSVTP